MQQAIIRSNQTSPKFPAFVTAGWLQQVRLSFMLLAASLVVSLLTGVYLATGKEGQSDAADQVYIRNERLARVGVFLIGELPGLILLGISARTDRWRQAVMALWLTRLMDVSMAGLFAANLIKVSSTEPNLLTIATWHLRMWLVWIDAWSLCVIIAEFAHIFRVNRVVEMTENLGKLIVVAAMFNSALTAYSVPRGFPPFLDETTATLCFITLALMLTCEIWIFINLTLGATIARLAKRKLEEQLETVR